MARQVGKAAVYVPEGERFEPPSCQAKNSTQQNLAQGGGSSASTVRQESEAKRENKKKQEAGW